MKKIKVIIAGAAGRDFSNYLRYFKDNPLFEVVAFTQTQIPGIEKRVFPKKLTGKKEIPMYPESKLIELIKKIKVDYVYLSYSDLSNQFVHEFASKVLAAGANFSLLGSEEIYVKSKKPVIAVTAVRTGSGKSQTSRALAEILRKNGKKVVGIRHSMPYSKDLTKDVCQRFASAKDFKKYNTTIEEEEEYQPWIDHGFVIYSGFDYKKIVKQAEKEADVIIFDGGNNDLEFIKADLKIVVADPHRVGHELTYYPGFVNFLTADVIIINKIDSAKKKDIETIKKHAKQYNPRAKIVFARSDLVIDKPELIRNKSILSIGDGPSLTHGGMKFGIGTLAIKKYKGRIIDPRKYTIGSIKETYKKYPDIGKELPAMGYGKKQIKDLEKTVNKVKCDIILDATPANLKRIIKVNKPIVNVGYELGKDAVNELEMILNKRKFIR
ncbi:MAG: GTPase [Candidatus Woesearchaeota archaeon]|nr:MAG: GTPase [Candidatus Woesearchaeota archaeon]